MLGWERGWEGTQGVSSHTELFYSSQLLQGIGTYVVIKYQILIFSNLFTPMSKPHNLADRTVASKDSDSVFF